MTHPRDHGGVLRRRRNDPPELPRKCFSVRARVAGTDIQRTATFRALNATHAEAMALDAFPDCFFAIATEVVAVRGFPLSAEQIALREQLKEASK